MRFFVARNGAAVVEKSALGGDDAAIDTLVAQYQATHPTFTVTEATQTSFDATPIDPTVVPLVDRANAISELLSDPSPLAKFIRAVLLVILDEINIIRTALSLTPRTVAQMKTAIQSKINAGSAD